MSELDDVLHALAASRHNLITRGDVTAAGGTDEHIRARLLRRQWQPLYAGVYLTTAAPPRWEEQLHGAVLATAGPAAATHRAALMVWELDGITGDPLEIVVGFEEAPVGRNVRIVRTRRQIEAVVHRGIPVTPVDRTLLDVAGCVPQVAVKKAVECAFRRGLVTPAGLERCVDEQGGRGVKGTRWLREYLLTRADGRAAGSAAEAELLHALEEHGIEPPVRQHPITLGNGEVAVVDAAWPHYRKAIEVDGFAFHSSPAALAASNRRQNLILEAGYELRRYAASDIRRDPDAAARSVIRFLFAPPTPLLDPHQWPHAHPSFEPRGFSGV